MIEQAVGKSVRCANAGDLSAAYLARAARGYAQDLPNARRLPIAVKASQNSRGIVQRARWSRALVQERAPRGVIT